MNLLTQIRQFDPIFWDYYQGQQHQRQLTNPFDTNGNHITFIENYFRLSGKAVLIHNFPIKVYELKRPSHVTSTFFLGLLIIHKCNVDLKIPQKNLPGYDTLPFIWFLTTLFHDFAENLERQPEFVDQINTLADLIGFYQISHKLVEQEVENVPPGIYQSIRNYFLLRREDNSVDHGIHAGLYMFDALVKNRIEKKTYDLDNHLLWDESLDGQYALAAASIAIHNIWVNQKQLNYKKFSLAVLKKFDGYSILDYPMPYVFGLVDTLDPVKFFSFKKGFEIEDVLNGLSISFSKNMIEITNVSLPTAIFIEYDKILRSSLKKWLMHRISRRKNILKKELQ